MRCLIRWGGLLIFAIGMIIFWHETGNDILSMVGLGQLLVIIGLGCWHIDK